MATYSGQIRQGLPRVAGGEPWPAAGAAPALAGVPNNGVLDDSVSEVKETPVPESSVLESSPGVEAQAPAVPEASAPEVSAPDTSAPEEAPAAEASVAAPVAVSSNNELRRGLPRVTGGEPWPEAQNAPVTEFTKTGTPLAAPVADEGKTSVSSEEPEESSAQEVETQAAAVQAPTTAQAPASSAAGSNVRRGLPRVAGGSPWPENASVPAWAVKDSKPAEAGASLEVAPAAETPATEAPATEAPATEATAKEAPATPPEAAPAAATKSAPKHAEEAPAEQKPAEPKAAEPKPAAQKIDASQPTTQKPASAPKPVESKPAPKPREPIMIGQKSLSQWVKIVVLGAIGAVVAAAILVLAARGVTTLPGVPEFMQRYPGEYVPLAQADPGFPAWARWSHFLNIFLMVLIIRSGLHVRTQQKPPAFFTPKKGGKKISINLWLHTSLDVIWVLNGVIFVVLLFVSGHWSRIIPTSLEVFPNAASAMLQYMTLDWPTENGWVNYNSLQQIMYFLVIFVAAPLAIITGVRMSEWWPEKADRLNKIYPAPLARAIHFPVMLFFVLFILIHVFLVLSTGALRNLNHMFAGTDVVNWTGFWFFALAIAVTVGGWFAARPLILAPIANLFGRVSNR